MEPVEHLRARAESYAHDGLILRNEGDTAMATAYRTIADELRKTARQVDESTKVWGSDCLECGNATAGSQRCDVCGSDEHTMTLYYHQSADEKVS